MLSISQEHHPQVWEIFYCCVLWWLKYLINCRKPCEILVFRIVVIFVQVNDIYYNFWHWHSTAKGQHEMLPIQFAPEAAISSEASLQQYYWGSKDFLRSEVWSRLRLGKVMIFCCCWSSRNRNPSTVYEEWDFERIITNKMSNISFTNNDTGDRRKGFAVWFSRWRRVDGTCSLKTDFALPEIQTVAHG